MIHIEQIGPKDLATLQEMSRETYLDTFAPSISLEDIETYMDEAYSEATLLAELTHPECFYYFLYENEEVLGYLRLNVGSMQTEDIAENVMELHRIYIRPTYKYKGYGNFLMEKALEEAKIQGCDGIWLGVWEHNDAAQHFYKKHGFVKIGEHVFKTGDQEDTDHILMKIVEGTKKD